MPTSNPRRAAAAALLSLVVALSGVLAGCGADPPGSDAELLDRGGAPGAAAAATAERTDASRADDPEEAVWRADQEEVRAILGGDPALQDRIWGDDFVVTNVEGQVFTKRQVMSVFERGITPYRSFERRTESVRVYGAVAVSIGIEEVLAAGTDRPERRRFTHVWVAREGAWELVARHATRSVPRLSSG